MYFYILSWVSVFIQSLLLTLSIGAGLFYLAEVVEEYVTISKKIINFSIIIDSILAIGLIIFEDLPYSIVLLGLVCNILYMMTMKTFPIINLYSPTFIIAFLLFLLHNYLAFDYFGSHYYEFYKVLCYMFLFCWLIPIGLLVSFSANDNVLPYSNKKDEDENLVSNYFRSKSKKFGLLSFLRYFNENYLPTIQSRKAY